jgi:hypothetical protein
MVRMSKNYQMQNAVWELPDAFRKFDRHARSAAARSSSGVAPEKPKNSR